MMFSGNIATISGPNLYGGLLDRCVPSVFAEVHVMYPGINYMGVNYLSNISNIVLDSISSLPIFKYAFVIVKKNHSAATNLQLSKS